MSITSQITGIDPTEQTFVMVTGYDPLDYSPILNVPAQIKDLGMETQENGSRYTSHYNKYHTCYLS